MQIYRHRLDDGLDAQLYVRVFIGRTHPHSVTLNQYNGQFTQYLPNDGHTLRFSAEEWKCFEHIIGLLMAFQRHLIHDNNFEISRFHVVGRIHADAEVIDGEPTVVLYDTEYDAEAKAINSVQGTEIYINEDMMEAIEKEFDRLDKQNPEMCGYTACFLEPGHYNENRSPPCPQCFPCYDNMTPVIQQ